MTEASKKKKDEDKTYKCPWCLKPFKTRDQAVKHERECPKRPVPYKGVSVK